jgi:hypothetical protein
MKTMTFAVAGLIGLVVGTSVQATDLTTNSKANPRALGRYMVNLGQPGGKTTYWGNPSGVIEFSVATQGDTWVMNDGDPGTYFTTYGSPATEDYFGYKFKIRAATVTGLFWANRVFWDGGSFATQPRVEYLTNPKGPWQAVPAANVVFNPPYDATLADGVRRDYNITLTTPVTNAWAIRLVGAPTAGLGGDTTGFVGCGELTAFGEPDLGSLDLTHNLALGGLGIASHEHDSAAMLVDGDPITSMDTWGEARPDGSPAYLGVKFPAPRYKVAAIGVWFHRFWDGGYFADTAAQPIKVEYTMDGTTWSPVIGLDRGRYPDMWYRLINNRNDASQHWFEATNPDGSPIQHPVGEQTCFLFRFNELNGITGLRIAGQTGGGTGGAPQGFVGAYEVEVYGNRLTSVVANFDASVDGDVDAADFGLFMQCWTGPTIPVAAAPDCANRDLDGDGDVDEADFGLFQRCFSGNGVAPNPLCGEGA